MATSITDAWLQSRLEAVQAQIEAAETAMLALSAGTLASYTIDTGQTTQTVTKRNLASLQMFIDSLYARLDYLDNRINGEGLYLRGNG
jgi:hypothetical protein